MKSTIGYLFHRYKNLPFTKAVILYDEKIGVNSMGRTGMSIIGKAIKEFRIESYIDGKL